MLGFPGIFRGAVDTWVAAHYERDADRSCHGIADYTTDDQLVPNPLDKNLHQAVAHAVASKAIEQGLARSEYVPYLHD